MVRCNAHLSEEKRQHENKFFGPGSPPKPLNFQFSRQEKGTYVRSGQDVQIGFFLAIRMNHHN